MLLSLFANAALDFFTPKSTPDPIVRLFQVEYAKEYNQLRASGINIDRKLALEHMNEKGNTKTNR